MALFDDEKTMINLEKYAIQNYNANEFIEIIEKEEKLSNIFEVFDLLTTKKFGANFFEIWVELYTNANELAQIELIYYVCAIASEVPENRVWWKNIFWENIKINAFFNKTDFYIKNLGFKTIQTEVDGEKFKQIIKNDVGEVLEVINDPKLNFKVNKIFKENDVEIIDKELFVIIKPFYNDFKKLIKKDLKNLSTNLKLLNRKIQTFVRHDEEHNDLEMKKFYKKLNDNEKIRELRRLTMEFLHVIYLVRENKG